MTWPTDKLGLINEQLALTANNLVAVADDGSDEWIVCSAAYEQALEYMLEAHNWMQVTAVVTLTPTGITPNDDEFDTAYAKPPDCVHVIWVRINQTGSGGGSVSGGNAVPINYQILNNQILVNQGGATNSVVTLKYVSANPPAAVSNGTAVAAVQQMLRTFMTALGRFVMAGIYRGLNEDPAQAGIEERSARAILQEAKTRSDQEQSKRAPFNSRITASRRVRRPFPPTPSGWGNTGMPG